MVKTLPLSEPFPEIVWLFCVLCSIVKLVPLTAAVSAKELTLFKFVRMILSSPCDEAVTVNW
jgi:hypothetical protein